MRSDTTSDGVTIPTSALATDASGAHGLARTQAGTPSTIDPVIDFTGANAIPAGTTRSWTTTLTAPSTGDYELKVQSSEGRASLQVDPASVDPNAPANGRGRGGRGGGGGGGGLIGTADGLSNATTNAHFEAGSTHKLAITATADATTPMKLRLAWIIPGARDARIAEAAAAAKSAQTAVVFAYDEGSEGRDRTSLSLPGNQDALIDAVAAANPRTIVVLTTGDPVLMPWANRVASILEMWYPGQEGADAITALLAGDANPGGRLPDTFLRGAEDAPTAPPERYPGVNGHGAYSEGIFVGYRWYDAQKIDPLFPFGHGLSRLHLVCVLKSQREAGRRWRRCQFHCEKHRHAHGRRCAADLRGRARCAARAHGGRRACGIRTPESRRGPVTHGDDACWGAGVVVLVGRQARVGGSARAPHHFSRRIVA